MTIRFLNTEVVSDDEENIEITFSYTTARDGSLDAIEITAIEVFVPALDSWINLQRLSSTDSFTYSAEKTARKLIDAYIKMNKLDLSTKEQIALDKENGDL